MSAFIAIRPALRRHQRLIRCVYPENGWRCPICGLHGSFESLWGLGAADCPVEPPPCTSCGEAWECRTDCKGVAAVIAAAQFPSPALADPSEILRRLRAEFDYLFARRNTVAQYAGMLESLVMTRLDEAGLQPWRCGAAGVAGLCGRCAHVAHETICSEDGCACVLV